MDPGWLEAIVLGVLLMVVVLCGRPTRRFLSSAGEEFARGHGLWIDAAFSAAVDRAHRRTFRAAQVAGVAGLSAYVAARLWWEPNLVLFLACGAMTSAIRAGFAAIQAGTEFPVPDGRPTVARARAVRAVDYLPPLALVLVLSCASLALVAAVAGLPGVAVGDDAERRVVTASTAVIALLMLGVVGCAIRVLARPQPAGDAAHLYLQDAWRSEQARTMLSSVGMLAVIASMQIRSVEDGPGLLALVLVVLGASSMLALYLDRHRYRRLWPDLPPGPVVVARPA